MRDAEDAMAGQQAGKAGQGGNETPGGDEQAQRARPDQPDQRDDEIARMRAELEELRAANVAREQPPEQARKASSERRWIADSFEGVVYVHNVDGAGTSRALAAGDEIPAGHEEQVRSHIPTTSAQPKSSRLREFDATLGGGEDAPTFDPRDHTVPQVNAYLDDNPEDVQRVLDLERSGAARIGILKKD